MKKFLTAFLFASSVALTLAAIGCGGKSDTEDSTPPAGERTVTFEAGEGYSFSSNASSQGTIAEGSLLTFAVELGAFYTGTPIAYVNDEPVLADANGIFSYEVGAENIVVTAEGIRKDRSNMAGSGTMEDAYLVTKPIDLVYIAEQVNAGNRAYTSAAYVLGNDIDCKGEELQIIGDYSTSNSYFSGVFSCVSDEDGNINRYTISNFTIHSESSNYVGLFGAVFADATLESSALIYGIRLENFEIYAGVTEMTKSNKSISCGGFVGYGIGANLTLCDAVNGQINVAGDSNYFAYVGGLIGYQQGFYDTSYGMAYPSDVVYGVADTDINIVGGLALYAGGISGYMTSNYPINATASIHNSYSLGDVNGALRTGGVVGGMGTYTAVSNSYASGEIVANAEQNANVLLGGASDEYCYAYAGGLVGYGENDSVVHDSFFIGNTAAYAASSGDKYTNDSPTMGYAAPAGTTSASAQAALAIDCLANDDVDLSDKNFFTNSTLKWGALDWVFAKDTLPVINYLVDSVSAQLKMDLQYLCTDNAQTTIKLNNESSFEYEFFNSSYQNSSYTPVGSWVDSGSGLPLLMQYYTADDKLNLSYGFFFDKACTQRVPLSYTPEKSFTVYVAFADPTEILGTYTFLTESGTGEVTLKLKADGTATYTDGNSTTETIFAYDGENLLIESARLARYFDGAITVDETDTSVFADASFDLNRYGLYNFVGSFEGGALSLYDGKFYTAAAPLVGYKDASSVLRGEYYNQANENDANTYCFYGNSARIVAKNGKPTYYAKMEKTDSTVSLYTNASDETPALQLNLTDLAQFDAFKGTWTKSATVNKSYTFDGKGNWNYAHIGYTRTYTGQIEELVLDSAKGTYTVNAGELTLYDDKGESTSITVSFDGSALKVKDGASTQLYYPDDSYKGVWRGNNYDLALDGIALGAGYGYATVTDTQGFTYKLLYEESETAGVLAFYYYDVYDAKPVKSSFFGYANYDITTNTLRFVSALDASESASGYVEDYLLLYDDFLGSWVTEVDGLESVEMEFNGLGSYEYLGYIGTLLIHTPEETVTVYYTLDSSYVGKFSYNGTTYRVEFNEVDGNVELVGDSASIFVRQDEFGDLTLITTSGDICDLDGRSTLTSGGSFTFKGVTYTYFPAAEGYTVKNADKTAEMGTLKLDESKKAYVLTLNGTDVYDLYITNEFMGDWAISGEFDLLHVGPANTEGVIKATFKGTPVDMKFLDPVTLQFRYIDDIKVPHNYYVFIIADEATGDDVLVISDTTTLSEGSYYICAKANALFGTWWQNRTENEQQPGEYKGNYLKFDGVTSGYVNGAAILGWNLNYSKAQTPYYYTVRQFRGETRMMMWSTEPLNGNTLYYRLDTYGSSEGLQDYYTLDGADDKYLVRTEVDGLYLATAKDKEKNTYYFDYDLNSKKAVLYVGDDMVYAYEILSYNDDNTASLKVTELTSGTAYNATLDYTDSANFVFTLGGLYVAA